MEIKPFKAAVSTENGVLRVHMTERNRESGVDWYGGEILESDDPHHPEGAFFEAEEHEFEILDEQHPPMEERHA